jgi:hypothetical protein
MNEKIRKALAEKIVLTWNGLLISVGPKAGEGSPGRDEINQRVALTLEGAADLARKEAEELYANLELFAEELESLAATIRAGEGQ